MSGFFVSGDRLFFWFEVPKSPPYGGFTYYTRAQTLRVGVLTFENRCQPRTLSVECWRPPSSRGTLFLFFFV